MTAVDCCQGTGIVVNPAGGVYAEVLPREAHQRCRCTHYAEDHPDGEACEIVRGDRACPCTRFANGEEF